ncbi:SGNH/GDSL hydrolase family protein [Chryseosolibacter indicus]|uniref:SGNH/GDSL hydrolase family protein n=1 Tax=Chryseosolibacter indicus TaxID=2782351 RepID=A0ABS5VXL1_9BACT|nr:SGNH/GDSL hydrolase family protein [Chryseosolibacter indicus]MBT1706142.1 SGNH/GDSL hydrolase family protein [Chryseosolibacter indicus]
MAQTLSKTEPIKFLALGDSYTIGESVSENERWPALLGLVLKEEGYSVSDTLIIATTGWRTDDLKRAIQAQKPDQHFNLVSLLIGVNNQYQGKSVESYEPEFEDLLSIAIQHAGGDRSKVFVVSIPDYGYTPFGKDKQVEISKAIDAFNSANQKITEHYGIKYINITDISRRGFEDSSLVAADGLHPSGKMYGLWVERIAEALIKA